MKKIVQISVKVELPLYDEFKRIISSVAIRDNTEDNLSLVVRSLIKSYIRENKK